MNKILLPTPNDRNQKVELEIDTGLVIVGANGSGKSRLGSWIELESGLQCEVHRISAQRSLVMPVTSTTKSYEKAEKELLYGSENGTKQHKSGHRWRNSPITTILNDYALLMVNLFSEENDISTKFRQQSLEGKKFELKDIPSTKLDLIRAVWEEILPHRCLIVGGAKVEAAMAGETEKKYNGSDMSDGERVMFYLIGQSLCAPKDSVIIIDEPEVHLHQGIQAKLWDVIERLRDDCTFIYITHDLDFAASRTTSHKICVKSYDGLHWDWFEVPDLSELPDEILLEVVGSRKPVIFIEGEKGSLDHDIYSLVYPRHTLKPVGSCQKVIEATKSFNEIKDAHKMECIGIIDRDHRDEEQIQFLEQRSIFCPQVAEVENLFLVEELLLKVAEALCVEEPEAAVHKIKDFVISQFASKVEEFSSKRVAHIIDSKLKKFDGSAANIANLKDSLHELHTTIDVDNLYEEAKGYAEQLIEEANYNEIIKVFNHKGIVRQIGQYFEVKPSAFIKKAKYLLANESNGLINIVRAHMPQG